MFFLSVGWGSCCMPLLSIALFAARAGERERERERWLYADLVLDMLIDRAQEEPHPLAREDYGAYRVCVPPVGENRRSCIMRITLDFEPTAQRF